MKASENITLAEKSAQKILMYIRDNNLTAGDKLPTEVKLVEYLGVGRNTVREALRILMSRNIIIIRQGAGAYLAEKPGVTEDPLGFFWTDNPQKLTRDLLQIRIILEPKIAALAAANRTQENLEELEKALIQVENAMKEGREYFVEDSLFHARIADCTNNTVMSNLIPVISKGVEAFSETVAEQEYRQTRKSHRAVFEAIRDKRSMDAEEAMYFHLLYNSNRY